MKSFRTKKATTDFKFDLSDIDMPSEQQRRRQRRNPAPAPAPTPAPTNPNSGRVGSAQVDEFAFKAPKMEVTVIPKKKKTSGVRESQDELWDRIEQLERELYDCQNLLEKKKTKIEDLKLERNEQKQQIQRLHDDYAQQLQEIESAFNQKLKKHEKNEAKYEAAEREHQELNKKYDRKKQENRQLREGWTTKAEEMQELQAERSVLLNQQAVLNTLLSGRTTVVILDLERDLFSAKYLSEATPRTSRISEEWDDDTDQSLYGDIDDDSTEGKLPEEKLIHNGAQDAYDVLIALVENTLDKKMRERHMRYEVYIYVNRSKRLCNHLKKLGITIDVFDKFVNSFNLIHPTDCMVMISDSLNPKRQKKRLIARAIAACEAPECQRLVLGKWALRKTFIDQISLPKPDALGGTVIPTKIRFITPDHSLGLVSVVMGIEKHFIQDVYNLFRPMSVGSLPQVQVQAQHPSIQIQGLKSLPIPSVLAYPSLNIE